MLRKKAPFLLKLVLLLAIVPLLALSVGKPAHAVLLLLDSATQAPAFGASLADKGDVISPEPHPPKQVIKSLPSGRIVLPGTKIASAVSAEPDSAVAIRPTTPQPDPDASAPNLIQPDVIEPESIAPEVPIPTESPASKSPAPDLPELELPQVIPSETKSPPQLVEPPEIPPPSIAPPESVLPPVPIAPPAMQPPSEPPPSAPENRVSPAVWVLLPSMVLGVLLFLWRGRRRNARVSKPVANDPVTRSLVVPAPPISEAIEAEKAEFPPLETQVSGTKTTEAETTEAETIEEPEEPLLADQQVKSEPVATEQPPAVIAEVPLEELPEALVKEAFEEQSDETLAERGEKALEASSELCPPETEGVTAVARLDPAVEDETVKPQHAGIEPPPLSAVSAPSLPPLTHLTASGFQAAFLAYLLHFQGKTLETATLQECETAFVRLIHAGILGLPDLSTPETKLAQPEGKLVAEIIPAPIAPLPLETTVNNLGLLPIVEPALQALGLSLSQLNAQHQDTAFSQSHLGSLMVGYLEALATAEVAAIGYGLRYVTGVKPEIRQGWQVEVPINRSERVSSWQWQRPDLQVEVRFGGQTHAYLDEQQHYRVRWIPDAVITGIPYDVPIAGYQNNNISLLRLWQPDLTSAEEFPDAGLGLCATPESLPDAMPEDEQIAGRLKQHYFLVACTVQDVLRLHFKTGGTPATIAQRLAVHLNEPDTVLAIAELMRLLLDEYGMAWEQAWEMTQQTFSYTQHSELLASVNQLYSLELFANLLPRHLEIIYEVNSRFLAEVRDRYPGEIYRVRRLSLIDEQGNRYVRLSYLACLGSHAFNSSSQLQTQTLQQKILRDFYQLYPEKFSNICRGITPRFGFLYTNPALSDLISDKIGAGWITDLQELSKLAAYEAEVEFVQRWRQIKQAAKQALADRIYQQYGISVDTHSLFDVQAIEFKPAQRHALNLLHIVTLYQRLKANPTLSLPPRTFIIAGTADPQDDESKLLIKLMHSVAEVINADPVTAKTLKIVYFDSYTPLLVNILYQAADIAEFLAVPPSESSNTDPLLAVMSGSLILGAANGLNLEMAKAMGSGNLFLFGATTQARIDLQSDDYQPRYFYETNSSLRNAIDQIASGYFSNGEIAWVTPLIDSWLNHDPCILLADYQPYLECQDRVSQAYRDPMRWTRISILNTIKIGSFSADRTVREYCLKTWNIKPVTHRLREYTKLPAG